MQLKTILQGIEKRKAERATIANSTKSSTEVVKNKKLNRTDRLTQSKLYRKQQKQLNT